MDFLLQTVIPYLLAYKYITIFVISFFAAFIVPVPSGDILMMTSAFADSGYFNITWVIIISIIANVMGDNLGYWVARIYGEDVLSKIGFRRILRSKTLKRIEDKFNKHPGFIIFASRFEVLSTLSVNLLSGLSKTNYKKFFIHEFFGTISQILVYSFMGYFFADNWKSINTIVGKVALVIALIIILFIIFYGKKKMEKKLE